MVPIAFSGRTLKNHKRNYTTMEQELLAIVYTLTKNYYMLLGHKVTVFTENSAVTYLKRNDLYPSRITQ